MAQRTAFLNSDAKGFNKDFHHTWIENYMLKQPGVLFSDYSTKPEFALGNGQIAGGKAIIRCTRTTGTFAGEEILASFESTTTENISTSGNKKIYIEIPEVYVNDSTAITDTLTQGANLGVGRIVSSSDYPTHSNYIPLWEVTGGDWQNATDLRPEVLRRGKPNTLSYFGGNGEEERIAIDNASLNKYLMSNGAGVAPSWEEGGGGGGDTTVENFKRTFTADTALLAKSMFGVEVQPGTSDVDSALDFGKTTATKLFFPIIINGEDFNSIVLNLKAVNSPSDSLSVRIETLDSNGQPSGTLVDVGAYATVSPTGTATDTTINLSGTITGLTAHTKAAIVLARSGTASDSNYYQLGCLSGTKVISQIYVHDGSSYSSVNYSGCVTSAGIATEAVVQATSSNGVDRIGYCETGAVVGNDFTGILDGTVEYNGVVAGTKYYLSNTGTITNSGGIVVGEGIQAGVLNIGKEVGSNELKVYSTISADAGTPVGIDDLSGKAIIKKVNSTNYTSQDSTYTNANDFSATKTGLTTVSVGNKILHVYTSGSNFLTVYTTDKDMNKSSQVVSEYKSYIYGACSPKEGYAVIGFLDRTNTSAIYPKAIVVDCTGETPVLGTPVVCESVKSDNAFAIRLTDSESTTFGCMWKQNSGGKTMFVSGTFSTSNLTISLGTPSEFYSSENYNGVISYFYAGEGIVGATIGEKNLVDNTYYDVAWFRKWDGIAISSSGSGTSYWKGDTTAPSSSLLRQVIGLNNNLVLVIRQNALYFVRRYHVDNQEWTTPIYQGESDREGGAGWVTYKLVDGGKHLLRVAVIPKSELDGGYQTNKFSISKYDIGVFGLTELYRKEYTTSTSIKTPLCPNVAEIDDNSNLSNPMDGTYYISYLNTNSHVVDLKVTASGGDCVGVLKSAVTNGSSAVVITGGVAPGTFSGPGKKVYIQNDGTTGETVTDCPIGISISTTQFVINK